MSQFSIEYLTSDKCGNKSPPGSESVSPASSFPTPPSSEAGSPTESLDIQQTLHVLQIQANKLKTKEKSSVSKAKHSYIALISEAILCHPQRRMLLNEIYKFILDKYPGQFAEDDKSWKNSIRHNLSLNECFVKVGRCEKGHYWAIHPAVVGEFSRGDFRRRQARRRVRRNLAEEQELQRTMSYTPHSYPVYPTTGATYHPYQRSAANVYVPNSSTIVPTSSSGYTAMLPTSSPAYRNFYQPLSVMTSPSTSSVSSASTRLSPVHQTTPDTSLNSSLSPNSSILSTPSPQPDCTSPLSAPAAILSPPPSHVKTAVMTSEELMKHYVRVQQQYQAMLHFCHGLNMTHYPQW